MIGWPHLPIDTRPAVAALLVLAGLAVVGIAVAYAAGRRRRRSPAGRPWDGLLTIAAAGIATAVAVSGMWRVFGDALGFDGPSRVALCAFLEIALVVSALRARRNLRERGRTGLDGAAVWAMALLSAGLAASDAHGLGRIVRFAAPLVAAWLWERGLAADRRQAAETRSAIAWRWTREKLAVWLGLADPAERTTTEVARARRLARLTRIRLRLAVLEQPTHRLWAAASLRPARKAWAASRLQRHALAAVEHLQLGTDPAVTTAIRTTVAAVVGLRDATAPGALTNASPWLPSLSSDPHRQPLPHQDAGPLRLVPLREAPLLQLVQHLERHVDRRDLPGAPPAPPAPRDPAPPAPPAGRPAPGEPTRRAVADLLRRNPELSQRQVASQLGISPTTVGRAMEHLRTVSEPVAAAG